VAVAVAGVVTKVAVAVTTNVARLVLVATDVGVGVAVRFGATKLTSEELELARPVES
jgi:FlaA1/EpsC-like NDP-sugar epimerase